MDEIGTSLQWARLLIGLSSVNVFFFAALRANQNFGSVANVTASSFFRLDLVKIIGIEL